MIVRGRLSWLQMLFVWRGSVVPRILPRLVFFFLYAAVVTFVNQRVVAMPVTLEPTSLALLGVTLAIFLGFRNSTSYDRFWEARKQWGQLLISARSFARQAYSLPRPVLSFDERVKVAKKLGDVASTLNAQLRGDATARAEVKVLELATWLGELRSEGRVDPMVCTAMDRTLSEVSGVIGACERIASTPIPLVYSVLLHRTAYTYLLVLPLMLVDRCGWWTPWVTVFLGYTFIGLDEVTAELEDPFGVEANDLPLDALTRTIERSTLELAGAELPPALMPDQHFVLR